MSSKITIHYWMGECWHDEDLRKTNKFYATVVGNRKNVFGSKTKYIDKNGKLNNTCGDCWFSTLDALISAIAKYEKEPLVNTNARNYNFELYYESQPL